MYMNPLERMKKIHLWIGTTTKTEREYEEYFGQNNDVSPFGKDIGIEEYDEDFIGIIPPFEQEIALSDILNEAPIDSSDIKSVLEECKRLNIEKANVVLYLTDASVEILKPYKDNYNELKYIGLFNSSL